MEIPLELRERNPLITEEGYRLFKRIQEHEHAPRWTYEVGDRVAEMDLAAVVRFRREIGELRKPFGRVPGPDMLFWVQEMRNWSAMFRERVPEEGDPAELWAGITCMEREDIALGLWRIVPEGADLSRLIVYDTSGTSGHALAVPQHPSGQARYHPLLEFVLRRYGVEPDFGAGRVACFNVGARVGCVTFPGVFSVWDQAGFAKVNLHPAYWRGEESARVFFRDLNPFFLNGDPVGFAEMLKWGIPAKPAIMISTSVALSPGLKERLESEYGCPVVDWYSTTETGPVAYACPEGHGLHVLPPDIFVEALGPDGVPVPEGELGELAVTGGRNPYLPLLRYRTGDWGRMEYGPCPCGDPMPRIVDLQGREPVLFRAMDGSVVNQVDVGAALRQCVFVQHEFVQRADRSLDVAVRPAPGSGVDVNHMEAVLRRLFGAETAVRVREEPNLGRESVSGKVRAYFSELEE